MILYLPLAGLLLGTLLRVLMPYLRSGLQRVAETGNFHDWPVFDYRYLAMVVMPLLEFGVAFLTVEGLWQVALGWGFIQSVALAYFGTDIGKEVVQTATAAYKLAARKP